MAHRHWLAFLLLILTTGSVFSEDQLKNIRIEIRLDQNLGSDISQSGETFTGTLSRQVLLGENKILRKGSLVSGIVKSAESTMNYYRPGELELQLASVTSGGRTYHIYTNTVRLQGKERRMDPSSGKQDDRGARREDATRAMEGVMLGGSNASAQTIPGTDIAVGASDRVTGMQVILPKNSKLTFTITLSD